MKPWRILFLLSFFFSFDLVAQEICDNQIDDDGDGLIDLNDEVDCQCQAPLLDASQNLITNPSFEEQGCCPQGENELFCTPGWLYASQATSDYCHLCGFFYPSIPLPLPDGEAIMASGLQPLTIGNISYAEYIATCQSGTLETGLTYSLQFSIASCTLEGLNPDTEAIEITLFGFESCPSGNPLIETLECPEPDGWYELGSVLYQPQCSWSTVTINFSPGQNTNSIMLGPSCLFDESYFDKWTWFFYDQLILSPPIDMEITMSGGSCIEDLELAVDLVDDFTYQWYFQGIAIPGQVAPTLNLGTTYQSGIYQVRITNSANGVCSVYEIEVPPIGASNLVSFESNVVSGCAPLEISFTNLSPSEFNGDFTWEINSVTYEGSDLNITLTESGLYTVTLTGITEDGCEESFTVEDYIEVFDAPDAGFTLSQLSLCSPFEVLFQPNAINEEIVYSWDFNFQGSSNQESPIIEYTTEGTYIASLEVENLETNCTSFNALEFELVGDLPSLEITGPSSICDSLSVETLHATFSEGTISWIPGGETSSSIEISQPGTYIAEVIRADGCTASDSIFVDRKDLPELSASNRQGCLGDEVQLIAESNVSDVRWPKISDNHIARVDQPGIYIAEAENECGVTSLEVDVSFKDCSCPVYVPNAFTPNDDGINDLFKPQLDCPLQYYELRIFNRWGEEVFKTYDPEKGWNGSSNQNGDYFGRNQIYNYILWYDNGLRSINEREKLQGCVQLIR